MSTKEERREQLRNRTKQNVKTKDNARSDRILDLSKAGDASFFTPEEGKNLIDILPFTVKSKHHPQGLKPGDEDYVLDIWIHSFVGAGNGSVLCLKKTFGKPCPICEEQAVLRKSDDAEDDAVKALNPKRKCIYNVVDLNNEDKGIQLFEVSHFLFEKELLEKVEGDDEFITFADLEEGRSIEFRAKKEKFGQFDFLKYKDFTFKKRSGYEEDVLEQTFPLDELLIIPTYDKVKALFYGSGEEEGQEDESEEKEEPKKKTLSRKPASGEKEKEEEPKKKTLTRGKTAGSENKKEKEETNSECPNGHSFGKDCDEHKDCKDCDAWESCANEQERMNAVEKD